MKKLFSSASGFTLVELIVVVTVIGVLTMIAVPSYKKYQARVKTSEAKLSLAALYTGEQSIHLAANTYVACVAALGVDKTIQGYYVTGFAQTYNKGKSSNKVGICDESTVTQSIVSAQGVQSDNGTSVLLPSDYIIIPRKIMQISAVGLSANTSDFSTSNTFLTGTGATDSPPDQEGHAFQAVAIGSIYKFTTVLDQWAINEKKTITQIVNGY